MNPLRLTSDYSADLATTPTIQWLQAVELTDQDRSVVEDGVRPTLHALHETVEITRGFTPWFEVGFYTFTTIQPHGGFEYVGNHIRPRFRVPESWGFQLA